MPKYTFKELVLPDGLEPPSGDYKSPVLTFELKEHWHDGVGFEPMPADPKSAVLPLHYPEESSIANAFSTHYLFYNATVKMSKTILPQMLSAHKQPRLPTHCAVP